jgi:PAS domain S-box-containing protein
LTRLAATRWLALLAAICIVGFHWLAQDASLGLAERVSVAAALLVYVASSRIWPLHAERAFRILSTLAALWVIRVVGADGFQPDRVLTLLMVLFGVGMVFTDALSLARFHTLMVVSVTGAMAWFGTETSPPLLLGVLASVGIVSWVVARARDEQTQQLTEMSLVAERVDNGVIMLDPEGRLTWFNEAFAKHFEVTDRNKGELLADVIRDPMTVNRIQRSILGGRPLSVELEHRSTQLTRWFSLDLTPIRDETGTVLRFVGIESDVSRTHMANKQIWNSVAEIMMVVDRDATIVEANDSARQLLRMTPLVGRNLRELVHNDKQWQLIKTLLSGDEPADQDAMDLTLGTEAWTIPVAAIASRLPSAPDQRRRFVLVARNIRERIAATQTRLTLEQKVQEAQRLESLGVLAGGIAHDFNNLLSGILGNASLALMRLPKDDEEARPLVKRIERTAQRAAELTHQMLAYSGKGQFVVEPLSIPRITHEMVDFLSATISKRAKLELEIDNDVGPIEGDGSQIRQLVMNLITNASDALEDENGTIWVRCREITVASSYLARGVQGPTLPPGPYVSFTVRDDGIGMSPETISKMFDPFFTTKVAGRGLGLAATLGIVRGHAGTLRVDSVEGVGTSIEVLLPRSTHPVVAADQEPSLSQFPKGRGGCVLVADDEPDLREFARAVLEHAGYDVLEAEDGEACVRVFTANVDRIGMILLDMTMPRMSGEEALEEIHTIRDVPVILSSGYSSQEARTHLGSRPIAAFLGKPYKAGALLDLVAQVIGER